MRTKAIQFLHCPGLLCLLLLLLFSSGCSYQSVRHLNRQVWIPDSRQQLQMNYLNFDYKTSNAAGGLQVQGTARPRMETLPDWAAWSKDIWLGAYLCDQEGLVLAQDLQILPAQAIDMEQGYEFQFSLQPQNMGSPGPVFLTFGYRLVLTQDPASTEGSAPEKQVFFASESALSRL